MLLNDNEYSLQTISNKTNITIENLEKLQNREWDKLKRAQAVGLLSIIEREFNVDLSVHKEEVNNFYSLQEDEEPQRIIDLVDSQSKRIGSSKTISTLITILTLGVVVYGSWYYFIDSKEDNNTRQIEQNSSGMFDNTISSVKNLLGFLDTNNSNVINAKTSVKEAMQKRIKKSKKSDTTYIPLDTNFTSQEEVTKSISVNNTVQDSNKVTQEVNIKKEESNKEAKSEVDKLLQELDKNNSNNASKDNKNSFKDESLNVAILVETTEDTNSSNENNKSKENNTTTATITNIDIKVKSKRLWLGIYNLTNGKKISKMVKGKFSLNVRNNDFAIITGHNNFEIVTDNRVKKFATRGKVYFTVSSNGIKEITKKEYKAITKSRAW